MRWLIIISCLIDSIRYSYSEEDDRTWVPSYLDDPEVYTEYTTPNSYEPYWNSYTPGAQYVGSIFAGRVEYNFIVDVRSTISDQEGWSIGSLVDPTHVITTCRAVGFLEEGIYVDGTIEDVWPVTRVTTTTFARVYYCTQYMWEDHEYKEEEENYSNYGHGTRAVANMVAHPKCSPSHIDFDVGVLTLRNPIHATPPIRNFLPFPVDILYENYETFDMSRFEQQRKVCYIVSFGRNYVNWPQHYAIDYKVKYRVYPDSWENCTKEWEFLCHSGGDPNSCSTNYSPQQKNRLQCFSTRARVGTVCDHDRGAPLVCNEEVFGIVSRGPLFKYCNNLIHPPFIVVKIAGLVQYFGSDLGYMFGQSKAELHLNFNVLIYALLIFPLIEL